MSFLKLVELDGFKSFARPTSISLEAPLVALVGPNGSGKSNVLDALRWALGERNPHAMRVSRYSELIFAGSASLPPRREASVALSLGGVRVSRSVDLEGRVELVVGDRRASLLELSELKRELGVRGEGYGFIGQGAVAGLIRANPAERRAHFEELFGVDAIRSRRSKIELELDEARARLVRLGDLMAELRHRLREIEPQAERARRKRALSEELRALEGQLVLARMEEVRRRLGALRSSRFGLLRRAHEARGRMLLSCEEVEAWERTSRELSSRLEGLREEGNALLAERIRIVESLKFLGLRYREAFLLSRRCWRRLEEVRSAVEEKRASAEELSLRLEGISARLLEVRSALEEARRSGLDLDLLEERLRLKEVRASSLREALEERRERAKALALRRDSLLLELELYERSLRELASRYASLFAQRRLLLSRLEEASARAEALMREGEALSSRMGVLRREAASLEKDLEERREDLLRGGPPLPVARLLSAVELGRVRVRARTVSQILKVPRGLEVALEAFLGGRIHWVVVGDLEEARSCIEFLKREGLGRATFLPLSRCRPRRASLPSGFKGGLVGEARDLLGFEEGFELAFLHLVGDLVLVRSYDDARALLGLGFSGSIATLAGEVFSPVGTVSGGSRPRSSYLALSRQVEEMERDLSARRAALKGLSERFASVMSEESRARSEAASLRREVEELGREISSLRSRALGLLEGRRRKASSLAQLEGEISALEEEISGLEGELEEVSREARGLREVLEGRASGSLRELRSEASALEGELARLEAQREALGLSLSELERERERVLGELERAEEELLRVRASARELGLKLSSLRARGGLLLEVGRRLKELSERAKERLGCASSAAESAREEVELSTREVALLEERISSLEGELLSLQGRALEMGLDLGAGAKASLEALERRRRKLAEEMASLGEVYEGALGEQEALTSRLELLEEQSEDLRRSLEEMERLLLQLEGEAEARFAEGVSAMGKAFDECFSVLFGGGEASLTVEDSGIGVRVRVPGKVFRGISHLSGGEQTLSAIALLFAAARVSGLPFVVLDEVDASLDEANLSRFVAFLEHFKRELQMVVVTHRRRTMEVSDLLWGVYMREMGVSSVLGVDMSRWS